MEATDLKKDIVYLQIKDLIVNGYFPMGAKISEGTLESTLQAKKAPIRDALKKLQAEKLVDRKAKSGTYVFSLNPQELDELLHFRFVIESQAALLSMHYEPQLLFQEIDVVTQNMRQCINEHRILDYLHLDSRFHELLIGHCGNRYFISSFNKISAIMDTVRNCLGGNPEHLNQSFDEHLEIARALKNRDADTLVHIYREHLLSECGSYWNPENVKGRIRAD